MEPLNYLDLNTSFQSWKYMKRSWNRIRNKPPECPWSYLKFFLNSVAIKYKPTYRYLYYIIWTDFTVRRNNWPVFRNHFRYQMSWLYSTKNSFYYKSSLFASHAFHHFSVHGIVRMQLLYNNHNCGGHFLRYRQWK